MRTDLELRCRCGQVRLAVRATSPAVASRVVCECQGCRDWAHRMDATEILDEHEGSHRFQVSPASLEFIAGRDQLRCLQQTRGGALRWYAGCCRTPLALTLESPRVPFVGLDLHYVVWPEGVTPEDALGPVRARVNSRLKGAARKQAGATAGPLFSMLGHLMPLTARWWWRGDAKASPFFVDGAPAEDVERLWEG